jgi:hypothetical protein
LATYLSLIDPALQPGADCELTRLLEAAASPPTAASLRAAASRATVTTLSIPAGPVTVNITINVGK